MIRTFKIKYVSGISESDSFVLDNYFREQCFSTAIFAKQQYGKEIAVSIRDFCQFYNITDEDINYESLYRHFFRKRDENFPNFVSNLCKKAGL